jgi:spore maturation protein B
MNFISIAAIPFMILIILSYALSKDVKLYDEFVKGAKDGITTTIRVILHWLDFWLQ